MCVCVCVAIFCSHNFMVLQWQNPCPPFAEPDHALLPHETCRWDNVCRMLGPPLLDPTVPDAKLAAWLDAHTMRVHAGLLHSLHTLRWQGSSGRLALGGAYGAQLEALPPSVAEPAARTAPRPPPQQQRHT